MSGSAYRESPGDKQYASNNSGKKHAVFDLRESTETPNTVHMQASQTPAINEEEQVNFSETMPTEVDQA